MLLFIEYLRYFTVKDFIQHTHSAQICICVRVWYIWVFMCKNVCVCAYGYSYGLISMSIYVFVSASACLQFLSVILTRPQYFFISFTLLIVLLYCYVLWCTFVTGQPLALIKMMNWLIVALCTQLCCFSCDLLWFYYGVHHINGLRQIVF